MDIKIHIASRIAGPLSFFGSAGVSPGLDIVSSPQLADFSFFVNFGSQVGKSGLRKELITRSSKQQNTSFTCAIHIEC
jgi:hypothetical protein